MLYERSAKWLITNGMKFLTNSLALNLSLMKSTSLKSSSLPASHLKCFITYKSMMKLFVLRWKLEQDLTFACPTSTQKLWSTNASISIFKKELT